MRALLSVYDKSGLIELASGLTELGWDLVASGGTSKALSDAGIDHLEVAELTGAPEMLGGRVKTLHPKVHGGILADRAKESHMADLDSQGISPISLVVCNLYPFESNPSIELIDVGGPTMVRAAAKNYDHVGVLVDPVDYGRVLDELRSTGWLSDDTRLSLAVRAFAHTAAYDAAILGWFEQGCPADLVSSKNSGGSHGDESSVDADSAGAGSVDADGEADEVLPALLNLSLRKISELRYGENPHQRGARYEVFGGTSWWDEVAQHGGTALSYLNLFDTDAAWKLVAELPSEDEVAVAIIKHANPCGAAVADDLSAAYRLALECDPVSAFGGIVALGGLCTADVARAVAEGPQADVIVAPGYEDEAVEILKARRKATRLLEAPRYTESGFQLRNLGGSYLVQEPDHLISSRDTWTVATKVAPTAQQWRDVELAWLVCARTTSNAIVIASSGQAIGVGAGQQSRVEAAKIAVSKAGDRVVGSAAASDAFFPFRDGLDVLAEAGVAVIVQPGGSVRDVEVAEAADEHGIAMVLTGERHFRH